MFLLESMQTENMLPKLVGHTNPGFDDFYYYTGKNGRKKNAGKYKNTLKILQM